MGWAMCRTEDGGKVESEQGQDVYTTSNYVFAQLLDYYGLVKESKEVYKVMDNVIFQHANSLISPDNLRAELEQEEGESAPGPHYIVASAYSDTIYKGASKANGGHKNRLQAIEIFCNYFNEVSNAARP
jgi:hypothetical protein